MAVSAACLAEIVLLFTGVAVILLSSIGILLGDGFDRLHYLGPATMFAPVLIAAAVIVRGGSSQSIIKVILLVLTLMLASPVLTHATGESGFLRKYQSDSGEKRQ
jgi:monovalent cation/proton antiporter MnhG/PhaG subunit